MKMKVSEKWPQQKNGGNANNIYGIICFKRKLPGAVAVDVSVVLIFVLLLRWFLKWSAKKMKLKANFKKSEQQNWGNANLKYAIRVFDRHLTYDVAVAAVILLCYCCVDCLEITAIQK